MSWWFRESTFNQPWSRLSNSLAYISLYFHILIRIERTKEFYLWIDTFSSKLEWRELTTSSVKQMLREAEQIEGLKNHQDKKCSINLLASGGTQWRKLLHRNVIWNINRGMNNARTFKCIDKPTCLHRSGHSLIDITNASTFVRLGNVKPCQTQLYVVLDN